MSADVKTRARVHTNNHTANGPTSAGANSTWMRLPHRPVWNSSVAIIAPATPTPMTRLPTDAAQTAAASQTSATRLR